MKSLDGILHVDSWEKSAFIAKRDGRIIHCILGISKLEFCRYIPA